MVNNLYLFCCLIIVFSCHSGKRAAEIDPTLDICIQRASYIYQKGENHFLSGEYEIARIHYTEALADSCLFKMEQAHNAKRRLGKKELLLTDIIACRIKQIDKIKWEQIRLKQDQCMKVFQHAEKLYKEQDYIKSKGYYERYKDSDCSPNDSMVDSRIKLLDSLIHIKKN